jgi:hypothetical protein
MLAWIDGNVTSLLLHLGWGSIVQFKSKCYQFGAALKPSPPIDQIPMWVLEAAQPEVIRKFIIE